MSKHVLAIVFNIYYIVKYKFSPDLTLKYKKKSWSNDKNNPKPKLNFLGKLHEKDFWKSTKKLLLIVWSEK